MALMTSVTKRRESVRRQLAGDSAGETLRMGNPPSARAIGIVVVVNSIVLAMNLGAYIWSAIAGFKGSTTWSVLNLVFYPVSPMIYGFAVRRDLGRRSGLATLIGINGVGIAIWIAFQVFRPS